MATASTSCCAAPSRAPRPWAPVQAAPSAFSARRAACSLPPRRRRLAHAHATRAAQQEDRPPGGGGGGSGGGSSSDLLSTVFQETIEAYDNTVRDALVLLEEGEKQIKGFDDQIREMRKEGDIPSWAFSLMMWSRGAQLRAVEGARKRHTQLSARRDQFVAGLRGLERELRRDPEAEAGVRDVSADWMATAGYDWATLEQEEEATPEKLQTMLREALDKQTPASIVWASATSSLILAWLLAWSGSWFGVDAYRLLHDPVDVAAAAPTWLAWTVPYVGGTLGTYVARPDLITKVPLRQVVSDQRPLLSKTPLVSVAAVATIISFCQVLTYQGLWQDAITGWLGGSRDPFLLTDPDALVEGVRQSMGTLVAAPKLPAFLLAPATAVLTGVLEASFYYAVVALRETQIVVIDGSSEGGEAGMWSQGPFGRIEQGTLTAEELPLVALRIALASTWLSLEATISGSLWLPVATSAAGSLTAAILCKRSAGRQTRS